MAYFTEIDPTITARADAGPLDTNDLDLLNAFGDQQTITAYDPGAGDNTLEDGEPLDVSTDDGSGGISTVSGTYRGDVTLSTADVDVGVPDVLGLNVQVNPIEGELFQDGSGSLYMISDEPVNDGRLSVSATVTVAGLPSTYVGPLSGLQDFVEGVPGAGGLLGGITDLSQFVLDTAVVTLDYDPTGTLVVCFARGTLIETDNGLRPIENLAVGDRVITRDNGTKDIRWIGMKRLTAATLAMKPHLRPIRISAGALGDNMPATDLLVSPQHRVLVRSRIAQRIFGAPEVLVAAKQLVVLDGIDVAQDVDRVDYFHLLLDRHEVIHANGAPTETLFTGPEALKAVGKAARDEIFALFPELRDLDYPAVAARHLASGRGARKLAMRHMQHGRPLVVH